MAQVLGFGTSGISGALIDRNRVLINTKERPADAARASEDTGSRQMCGSWRPVLNDGSLKN